MKKLLVTLPFVAAALLMASAALAFTHYPNASCPDTLSIVRLKTLLNTVQTCAPVTSGTTGAPGDTVNGVGGIIIGFDEIPTGFDIYVEQTSGGVNSGIDVFTHGTNFRAPYGFQRGDSMVVEFARVANFNGDVEVEAPNNNFSNPDIVMRKVSTGNPLPAYLDGTTTDFQEKPSNTYIAQYMTTLVHLTGPVRVARLTGLSFHGAIVVSDAAPSDSVFIDYAKLTNIVPPALGTVLTDIYGIVNNAARGYRIMPRDAHDVVDTQPPGISDCYPVADNQYRLVFDRDVTVASATNPANYTLASFGSVDGVAMDGTNAVILNVTTGLLHGASEKVTVNGVVGLDNGVAITDPNGAQTAPFVAGLLSIGEISAPNPDSLAATPCRDVSKFVGFITKTGQYINGDFGPRSSITGIVTGIYGNLYYMEDATPLSPANNHRGVTVFAPPVALLQGHQYLIAGADEEFYSENEFAAITYVKDVGTPGVPTSIPLTVAVAAYDTCDVNQNIDSARDYLSELVTLSSVKVVQRFPTPTATGFHVVGPSPSYTDTVFIENVNTVLGTAVVGNPNYPAVGKLVNVTGVVHYTTNTSTPSFRVAPRNPADITILGTTGITPGTTGKLSFSVYPNPARTVNVAFTLPTASNVDIGVYDLFGRRVATIASGRMPAGDYQKAWAGLDAAGNAVHSGVYFYRLRAGDQTRTARTMLIGN